MKKRFGILISAIILITITLQGRPLSPDEAITRLASSNGAMKIRGRDLASYKLASSGVTSSGNPAWYAFSKNKDGWVILSGDDCAAPLLAYSDTGYFNFENSPESLRWWLNQYAWQIENSKGCRYASASNENRNPIIPMVKTTWDQNSPFNTYTPEIDGAHAPTGCVATSMAQLMKYYNYPDQGKGTLSYIMQGSTLSLDLSSFKFAWSDMSDNYFHNPNENQIEAVAKLMQACGYAVESIYYSNTTEAQVYQWPRALIDNFGYAPTSDLVSRIYYTDQDWENIIYSSLANGCPVLYSGLGSAGGHAFICDGYAGDGYYHFNWGWAGLSDGYFLLSALNPTALGTGGGAGGFNSGQIAVVNCRPNYPGAVMTPKMGLLEGTNITYSNISKNFTLIGGLMNLSPCQINTKVGFEITGADGSTYYAGEGNSALEFPLQNIMQTYARKLSVTLEDGTYQVRPVFGIQKENSIEWHRAMIPINQSQNWILKITNGKGEISESVVNSDVSVSGLTATTGIYVSSQFKVAAKIENKSDLEFMSDVYVLLYDKDGNVVYSSDANPVDIMGKNSMEVDFTCVPGGNLKAGTWEMGLGLLVNKQTKQYSSISDKITVTVNPFQLDIKMEASDFQVKDADNVNPENVTLTMKLTCVQGHYADPLRIWIRPVGSTGTWGQMMQTQYIYMKESETRDVSYSFSYPKGIAGTEYELISNYVIPTAQSWLGNCKFRISDQSGISQTEIEAGTVKWYNLQGIPCTPSSPGIYIRDYNGKRNKVIIK